MKTFILQILHFLWIRRDQVFELWDVVKKDWKINRKDFFNIIEYYANAWFIPEENDRVFVGGIKKVKPNESKNIVQYDQSKCACAIYSRTRNAMYNVKGLVYTKDEVEAIANYAVETKRLDRSKGMTFADADDCIVEWTLKNKGIQLKFDKVKYWSAEHIERTKLWYGCSIGGGITSKYLNDFRFDGIIDEQYTFDEEVRYNHAFSQESDQLLTENYPTQFGNNNRYKNEKVQDFVNESVFFSWAYYIFSDQEIEEDQIEEMKENLFVDVDGSADFYDSIKWAKENGIVQGYQDGTLRPKENITVDRMLAILNNYDKQAKK